jgi:AcrR family transcriptional regulator
MAKSSAPKTRKRDREATTKLILEASISVFSKVGFGKATTKEISQKAGVAEALILRYFGTKRGLLLAILKHFLDLSQEHDLDYPPQATIEDELEKYATRVLKSLFEIKIFKVLLVHSMVDEKFSKDFIEAVNDPELKKNPLEERFDHLRRKGEIPKDVTNKDILHGLTLQYMGIYLMGKSLFNFSSDESGNFLKHSIRAYAKGLKA